MIVLLWIYIAGAFATMAIIAWADFDIVGAPTVTEAGFMIVLWPLIALVMALWLGGLMIELAVMESAK